MQLLHDLPRGTFIRTLAPTDTTRFLRAPNNLYPGMADDYLAVDIAAIPERGSLVLLGSGMRLSTGVYDPCTTEPDSVLGVVTLVALSFL